MSETLTGRHALSGGEPERPDPGMPLTDPDAPLQEALEPPLAVPPPGPASTEHVTCPECGTAATVALTRRDAADFCAQCDYPLFWTPNKVVLDVGATAVDSLRRLPGTSGRVTVGSLACPHCAESNLLSAELCVRCGGLMHPPAPEPVVVTPPPPPPPEPEPTRTPLWVWILGGTTLLLLVALVVYFVATR
ncbi:hypothetical protein [Nocardioides sp. YIM 152315]|uniref:hypothetical protein n=1 Tax=Nocardioides sp. YIM 152315 TaxID=3031760 RepID=UPI0023DBD097|nr:hypothetical protein [Nocardioides sp. YIM 152315]MDF1603314.1 hypothetical protein [Nocardioides sp. YIM 152315]